MGINVLSLFDGMSCGQQALERAGIKVDKYFASEIDKYAIQVTMANYPNTIQLGSVVNLDGHSLPKIDLLIGGSPCQSFSFAGKRKGMSTKDNIEILTLDHYLELKYEGYEFEGQSYLFWEYIRLLKEVKPTYFLLENVMMGEKWEKVLSKAIGVNPIEINSALVSAQNRRRLYWFGQIRERLFFNDNLCYTCRKKEHEQERQFSILGKTQGKREDEVLGETQGGQISLRNLQKTIFENREEGNNKNLLTNLSVGIKKEVGQKQEQGSKKSIRKEICRTEQGSNIGISEELQKDAKRERSGEESRDESIKEDSKINEDAFASSINWTEEEAEQRRINYHSKYGKEMCCVQCGKRINHRSHTSFVEGWDKLSGKSPSTLSEMQFNEARQNNGRVFDILEIGVIDSDLFGETILPIQQPKDKGILLKDILENEVDEKYYLSNKMLDYLNSRKANYNGGKINYKTENDIASCINASSGAIDISDNIIIDPNRKARCFTAGGNSGGLHSQMDLICHNYKHKNPRTKDHTSRNDGKSYSLETQPGNAIEIVKKDNLVRQINPSTESGGKQPYQQNRIYDVDGISPALCANKSDLIISGTYRTHKDGNGFRQVMSGKGATIPARAREDGSGQNVVSVKGNIRRLTPTECERLQTVKEGYTSMVSDTQRYKMLGNGWTIDVIKHIFSYLPKEYF